jgi:hypothetical protein
MRNFKISYTKPEPRNIVLILGNGFDLDLGLKTSYKNFWESDFCPKDYPAPIIKHLNKRWPDNLEAVRWYDLENELLNYYKGLRNLKDGVDFITEDEKDFLKKFTSYGFSCGWYNDQLDLIESLIKKGVLLYQENQVPSVKEHYKDDALQTPIWRDRKAFDLIKNGLCNYLKSIDKPIPDKLSTAFHLLLSMTKTAEAGDFINIFTFNYTRVQISGRELKTIPVHYMHGCCENGKIIIGTRDDLSIDPVYDFLLKAMDDSFTPPDIVTPLKEADEVIIFGHSLGENDRQYFAPFFLRQAEYDNPVRKDITIFTRDSNSKVEIKRALQKMTDGKLSALFSFNQPNIIRTANLQDDQKLLYDFLVNHHTDKRYASEVIGKLTQ